MKFPIRMISFLTLPIPLLTCASEFPDALFGVKGGYQWAFDDTHYHSEPSGAMSGIYGGLRLSPAWRWDVGYQYHDELEADSTQVNVTTWLVESALRYDWYLNNNFSVYGRLGVAYWDIQKKAPTLPNILDGTGFSPLGEFGLNYSFTSNLDISAGYQYIGSIGNSNTGEYDSHGIMVGVTYTFGDKDQPLLVEPVRDPIIVEPEPESFPFPSHSVNVTFDSDSVELGPKEIHSLSDIVSVLQSYPQAHAVIVGHTDATGSVAYNQTLSEKRAEVVANQVIELGVPIEQLKWIGEGELKPIADNGTAEGRAKNRRVEVSYPLFQIQE